jgi:CDP-glucose 4,6-dehydratase
VGPWGAVEAVVGPIPDSNTGSHIRSADLRDRRVLVTGATGLLGSWLVADLQSAGADVVALVRDRVPRAHLWELPGRVSLTCVSGQLEDYATLARTVGEYEIEIVFHLGAQTIVQIANRDPISTFESNIRGTWNLLEACRRAPTVKAIVVASSDKAYGDHDRLPYDESTPLQGRHPYDVSKACADLIATAYHRTYELPVAIVRCGNLFGPGDLNFNRLIPGTIRSILRGEAPVIRSDGTFIRDYLYVKDAARAYVVVASSVLDGIHGDAYNFSNEVQISALDMVRNIGRLMSSSLEPTILNEGAGEIVNQYLDAGKARRQLGWEPIYALDDALRETINWYAERMDPRPSIQAESIR